MANLRFGETARSIHLLFSGKSVVGQSDGALLRRFVSNKDEEAFRILVARHGPMVCTVCRGILKNSADVEDAFQATFLILARRAGSLWIDESLGGWLYRVAYRVAVRANREASRRRNREQVGVDLSTIPAVNAENSPLDDVHEAIALLPERYRRPLVLCDIEGLPQLEAAKLLNCGEATLRRRLAGARERLGARLKARGVPLLALSQLGTFSQPDLPASWAANAIGVALKLRPASEFSTILAASVVRSGLFAKGFKIMLASSCLIAAVAATFAFSRTDGPKSLPTTGGKPAVKFVREVQEPVKNDDLGPIHWVHLKSDRGEERWANLDKGIEFRRKGKDVWVVDAVKKEWLKYEEGGSVERSKPDSFQVEKDRFGRILTASAKELELDRKQTVPKKTPAFLRPPSPFLTIDYDFDLLDGHQTIRLDQYDHDALGATRLQKQIWFDVETRRRLRMKDRYQLGEQQQYGKEFETTDYDYPDSGPADMTALGVPKDAKFVDLEKTRSSKWKDQSPEVRKAITAQTEAIRKFPRDLRVITEDKNGTIHLEYATLDAPFVEGFCQNATGDTYRFYDRSQVRYFRADNQNFGDRPETLFPSPRKAPDGSFDGDHVAKWFPIDKSINTGLSTADMTYHLTRFASDDVRVHVMDQANDSFPKIYEEQWPITRMRGLGLEFVPSTPDTPPGMVVIKTHGKLQVGDRHEPYPHHYTLDPAHDWIAVRQVSWRMNRKTNSWDMTERHATGFQQLPSGSWYVSLWKTSETRDVEFEKTSNNKPERKSYIRVNVTPLRPEEFPKDIFNGPLFLENAKKNGAKIEPN